MTGPVDLILDAVDSGLVLSRAEQGALAAEVRKLRAEAATQAGLVGALRSSVTTARHERDHAQALLAEANRRNRDLAAEHADERDPEFGVTP